MAIVGRNNVGWHYPGIATPGTASAHHLLTGKTAWVDGSQLTGTAYTPAMMQFNGSTDWYSKGSLSLTSVNVETAILRFALNPVAGVNQRLFRVTDSNGYSRMSLELYASDDATYPNRLVFFVADQANTGKLNLYSNAEYADGKVHTVFTAFNGDTGSAVFVIDGNDSAYTTTIAPTAGTLGSGTGNIAFGATYTGTSKVDGQLGFIGYKEAYLTNWSDFMHTDGSPKELDVSSWTEWGAQPLFWHEAGKMDENRGSAGAMTANGTITLGTGGYT